MQLYNLIFYKYFIAHQSQAMKIIEVAVRNAETMLP